MTAMYDGRFQAIKVAFIYLSVARQTRNVIPVSSKEKFPCPIWLVAGEPRADPRLGLLPHRAPDYGGGSQPGSAHRQESHANLPRQGSAHSPPPPFRLTALLFAAPRRQRRALRVLARAHAPKKVTRGSRCSCRTFAASPPHTPPQARAVLIAMFT